ncbi:MAG: hypothetical protein ACRDRA_14995 [Pseudonocardiaceae bacterium]
MSRAHEIRTRETSLGTGIPRRVVVKGREGVAATVVVRTYRGEVWMSIMPPFTWEAIMEIRKVDELIHELGLAREEAIRSVTSGTAPADRGRNGVVREIGSPD